MKNNEFCCVDNEKCNSGTYGNTGICEECEQSLIEEKIEEEIKDKKRKKSTQAQVMSGDGSQKRENNYYPTPTWVTERLINYLPIDKNLLIHECCSGEGYISKVLESKGYNVLSTELFEYCKVTDDYGKTFRDSKSYGYTGINYLTDDIDNFLDKNVLYKWNSHSENNGGGYVDLTISNPPFILATEFTLKAFTLTRKQVIYLVKLNFLASDVRTELLWKNKKWEELTKRQQESEKFKKYKDFVIAKDKCVNNFRLKNILVIPERLKFDGFKDSTPLEHAWFCFENGFKGDTKIDWLIK